MTERSDWFVTASGKRLFLLSPDPEAISLFDIAHASANICRFGGHTKYHYSVAQHAVLVSELVELQPAVSAFAGRQVLPILRKYALLHDATEAFLGDVIRPLKRLLPDYRKLERDWDVAICKRFGLLPLEDTNAALGLEQSIKIADMRALATERRDLINFFDPAWLHPDEAGYEPDTRPIARCDEVPETAATIFLMRAKELGVSEQ